MAERPVLGFIGLGVMGEPMCRNLALKGGADVLAYDISAGPLQRLAEAGVRKTNSVREIGEQAEIVFLSLPGGPEVEEVCLGAAGLATALQPGQVVVDLSTAPLGLTRRIGEDYGARGVAYADAPVARTREAAIAGTLSIMVGSGPITFERIRPYLACMASDITHCGDIGSGQVTKILNNMVLFQIGVALSEAITIGTAAGVDGKLLFETLSKGSADSFCLRNHGMKAILPGVFPERAFSAEYAMKDLSYALDMAELYRIETLGAETAAEMLQRAIEQGHGAEYWPVIVKAIGRLES
jgi:3-hydroxyisobutyrate dehydrogenase-like beta-hydroxyacid dehydrogenase